VPLTEPKRSHRATPSVGSVTIRRLPGYTAAVLRGPRANRLTAAMAQALIDLAEETEDDERVRFLVIAGGGGNFCAGFEPDVDGAVVESLAAVSKPTLALIEGQALDEGLELALALDLRVAHADARMGLRQLLGGQLPRFGGSQRLPRLIGVAPALRMMMTGATVSGRQALKLGLVTYTAASRGAFAALRDRLVASLLARAPLATRLVKEAIVKGYDLTLDQGIRLEEDLYALLQTTADRAEGVRAFLDKRKPLFKGR